MTKKKKPAAEFDFEDAETLIRDEEVDLGVEVAREIVDGPVSDFPPALPFDLTRRSDDDAGFIASLPAPSKAVLENVRKVKTPWPNAPRIQGAIATPVKPPKK
jgi:hypothetical protein